MATTVDLPLVPATAMVPCSATKCASRRERCTMGRPRAVAAPQSRTWGSAAAGATALHHLELSESTHAAAAETGVMEAAGAGRIRDGLVGLVGSEVVSDDDQRIALFHPIEEVLDVNAGHAHAAVGCGHSDALF